MSSRNQRAQIGQQMAAIYDGQNHHRQKVPIVFSCEQPILTSGCKTRQATAAELEELDRTLGPVGKGKGTKNYHYDEQFMRPHRVVPRHKGDTVRVSRFEPMQNRCCD